MTSQVQISHFLLSNPFKTRFLVAAFFIFNGKTNSFNVESLEGQSHAKAMRESCQRIQEQIGNRIFDAVSHGRIPRPEDLMKTEDIYELKSKVYGAEGRPLPPIVTHNLIDSQKVSF